MFIIEYNDGLKGYVIQLQNEVEQWSFAFWRAKGNRVAALCDSDIERPFGHFDVLTHHIEDMIVTGKSLNYS
ncbi:hypothetical protein [Paenibacillus eucommiae]|uniref:Uncharacterized protein n=1 Tax=Paenibacillus eucommiae TaxID=1355755 RepID=A0ABS4IXV5_9BACL|nr:hypothetical protein [Paenibacillus eucommiae]MBP1992423.1 hypothetical protein [Paenibacillus eucommiae]